MKTFALPVWNVVNLDVLVKSGLPAAFVRSNSGVALFTAQTIADVFIRDSKAEQNYVPRAIETAREFSWFLTSLERAQIEHVHINPGQPRQKLCRLAELRTAAGVDP